MLSQENKLRLACVTVLAAVYAAGFYHPAPGKVLSVKDEAPWTPGRASLMSIMSAFSPPEAPPRLIAHAGGIYEGKVYTNSIAALEQSYAAGYRLLEVDLNLTTDNQIVLLHDWDYTVESVYGLSRGQRDLQTFLTETAPGYHRVAQLDDLADWAMDHPGARIMLDTKVATVPILKTVAERYPELKAQFVPLIYQFQDYGTVSDLGFSNISLLVSRGQYTPEALLAFARNHPLYSMSMQPETLTQQLSALPRYTRVYIWTINDMPTQGRLLDQQAYGVVTDTLRPPATPEPATWIGIVSLLSKL
jgi:glycerophosphoryl diester phosphodiesterase